MMLNSRVFLLYLFGMVMFLHQSLSTNSATFKLIILHNNDMHAQFEQMSQNCGVCTPAMRKANKCFGGFARVASEVRKYRNKAKHAGAPVLYLNSGNTYTCSAWFRALKENTAETFLNKLQPDAVSLGIHEMSNVDGLMRFLNNVNFPVLACNLDTSKVPELAKAKNLYKSTVLNVRGVKIGIIGYITPSTKSLTPENNIEFLDEIESIKKESARLQAKDVKIIIALGHSGYDKDQEIAHQCPDVDLVIGGHSLIFLYSGKQPDIEEVEGPYPTKVIQKSGKMVPVVQAYAYTKYLGKLQVTFDQSGNLTAVEGLPILLNSHISQEHDVLELIEKNLPNYALFQKRVVGHTQVFLDGRKEICRTEECAMGDLMTDALVYATKLEFKDNKQWNDTDIGFYMAGGIIDSILKRPSGEIYASDVFSNFELDHDFYVSRVSGKSILKSLKVCAAMDEKEGNPCFLQVSGLYAVYDHSKELRNRVASVHVRCGTCDVPTTIPLNVNKMYNIVVPERLLNGACGHTFREYNTYEPQRLLTNQSAIILQYLRANPYIISTDEVRITVVERT